MTAIVSSFRDCVISSFGLFGKLRTNSAMAETVGLELGNAIMEKYLPADQQQQFSAANQGFLQASRVVIVLKPEKVVGWAWTAL